MKEAHPKQENGEDDAKYNELVWAFVALFTSVLRSNCDSHGEVGLIQVTGGANEIFFSIRRIDYIYDLLFPEMA